MARPQSFGDTHLRRVARKAFLREGADASVSTIAKELAVTPAAIFHRCGSKGELLEWTFSQQCPPELSLLQRGPDADQSGRGQLINILVGLGAHYCDASAATLLLGCAKTKRKAHCVKFPVALQVRAALVRWLQRCRERESCRSAMLAWPVTCC
jgi:AcrR family transcriptional regulator